MRRFVFFCLLLLGFLTTPVQAAPGAPELSDVKQDVQIKSPVTEIHIPGFNPNSEVLVTTDTDGRVFIHLPWIGDYIAAIYKFGLAMLSVVAVALLIRQGFQIVLGGEGQANAYKRIGQIVIAVCIGWGSYAILYFLNPALTQFKALSVEYIKPIPLPEENDTIEPGQFPILPNVQEPSWDYKTFDCDRDGKTPMGVMPPSGLETYRCPYIDNAVTTVPEMRQPLCRAAELAQAAGYTFHVTADGGSYRSYEQQVAGWCNDKRSPLDKKPFRAVPGHSNHGLGRAVDVFLVDKKGNQLFGSSNSEQCQVPPDLIAKIATFFYNADPGFKRLETEIWHFEFNTTQALRSRTFNGSSKCK